MNKILNIAHRGFSGVYPENTMLAFKKAVKAGADAIEVDLHMTKDNVIVICHDETLDRTTNGKGFIKDYTYSEINKFDAGRGEKVPSLDDFLNYMKNRNLYINLELKNNVVNYDGIEKNTIKKIYDYALEKQTIISSFNDESLKRVKQCDSSMKTGLLYGTPVYKPEEYGKKLGVDALHPLFSLIMDQNMVRDIHKAGLLINVYTVNHREDMRKLIKLGVNGIITNYPNILNKLL